MADAERRYMVMRTHRGLPRWLPVFAVIVDVIAFVLGSVPLAHLAHFAAVRHVLCEHGELMHVELDEDESAVAAPESKSDTTSCSSGRPISTHSHVHCTAAKRAHIAQANLVGPTAMVTASSVVCVAPLLLESAGHPCAVWHFAPKTSPPA